jgi:hypothetical protein
VGNSKEPDPLKWMMLAVFVVGITLAVFIVGWKRQTVI